jgi:hypothetical protein
MEAIEPEKYYSLPKFPPLLIEKNSIQIVNEAI